MKITNWESKIIENQESDSYCTYVITLKEHENDFDHDLNENEYMMWALKEKT